MDNKKGPFDDFTDNDEVVEELDQSSESKQTEGILDEGSEVSDGDNSKDELLDSAFITLENSEEYYQIVSDTIRKVMDCIAGSKDAIIQPGITTQEIKKNFPIEGFPEEGSENNSLELVLDKSIVMNFGSPNYFGQILPARSKEALISTIVSSILNQNIIAEEVSHAYTQMENQVIGYLADLVGYDLEQSSGSIVSGGTVANLTAVLVARNMTLLNADNGGQNELLGVSEIGIEGSLKEFNRINNTDYSDVVAYVGQDNHYSINKLLSFVGIGTKKIVTIPYKSGTFDLDTEFFQESISKSEAEGKLVMGTFITAGTTDKGHVHNIEDILDVTKGIGQNGREIYTHIDAAHGGGYLVLDELKNTKFSGISQADSVTIDGHKMLYTNYSCGGIVFKDKHDMLSIKHTAEYIMAKDSLDEDHGKYTVEGSRGSSGVHQLWSNIKTLGKEGYTQILNNTLDNAKFLYEILEADDQFEVTSGEPELNIVCFKHVGKQGHTVEEANSLHKTLKNELEKDGTYYVGETSINGVKSFKAIFINLETSREHIEGFVNKLKSIALYVNN